MHTLTDSRLAALCGMTPNNLRMTYKKNPDPTKQRVYEFLRMGAEAWLKKQERDAKNKELIEFLEELKTPKGEMFEHITDSVAHVKDLRKGRAIESFD
jgi:hypothetical protein